MPNATWRNVTRVVNRIGVLDSGQLSHRAWTCPVCVHQDKLPLPAEEREEGTNPAVIGMQTGLPYAHVTFKNNIRIQKHVHCETPNR